ncbi:hypothetical protein [Flammeovirga aprica]|uniref:Outer membrane protein beta-barrel domain-containing protein n=1 Tax=Flammeovirga aprica JL-4 TaxID=694437 RepID=A0A7X9RWA4_9BACT|nr:hypothetical protein [Flammeovirga aprica]NME69892.1 hypothetical protein [Flammeovirga aprica JL-4]
MKKSIQLLVTLVLVTFSSSVFAQNSADFRGPNTLNVGIISHLGVGSLGVQADYEIAQLGQDFTIGASAYYQGWSDTHYNYSYFGVGARVRWYADRVLGITDNRWDVFASGDLGFRFGNASGKGDLSNVSSSTVNPLYLGIGIGGKFHINDKISLQAIIGSGAQFGVAFQL